MFHGAVFLGSAERHPSWSGVVDRLRPFCFDNSKDRRRWPVVQSMVVGLFKVFWFQQFPLSSTQTRHPTSEPPNTWNSAMVGLFFPTDHGRKESWTWNTTCLVFAKWSSKVYYVPSCRGNCSFCSICIVFITLWWGDTRSSARSTPHTSRVHVPWRLRRCHVPHGCLKGWSWKAWSRGHAVDSRRARPSRTLTDFLGHPGVTRSLLPVPVWRGRSWMFRTSHEPRGLTILRGGSEP